MARMCISRRSDRQTAGCFAHNNSRLLLFPLRQIFLHTELNDFRNQIIRNGLIERELDRTLGCLIASNFLLEFLRPARRGIKPDVMFEGGKMDEIPIECERRHLITDLFLRVGSRFFNDPSYFLQDALNFFGKAGNILINSLGS